MFWIVYNHSFHGIKYDKNGCMTQDLNKNICSIEYNLLNLPTKISFTDGSTVKYCYSADGEKLSADYDLTLMNVMNGTSNSTQAGGGVKLHRDYCGDFIYEDGALKTMLFDGGYVTFAGTTPEYHFYLKDHLGNNRVVASANGDIEQVNHYYPFGGLMADSKGNTQSYKYNGKELDRMHGLDSYDYGARWMTNGRFFTPDPHATDYPDVSPYAYCGNNPVYSIDVNGEDNYSLNSKGYVRLKESTNNPYDILSFGSHNIFLSKGILGQLAKERKSYSGHFATSSNQKDVVTLFMFAAKNTNVEWGMDAYNVGGKVMYNVRTTHQQNEVDPLNKKNDKNLLYTIHSHSQLSNSHQASGPDLSYVKDGETVSGYYDFGDVGRYGEMANNYQKFHKIRSIKDFPKAYIYDVAGKTYPKLFQYTHRNRKFNSRPISNLKTFIKYLKR